jgi:arylsulfatase A-like enzyme
MGLVHRPWLWKLNPDERHISHLLRDVGYYTAQIGILHETGSDEMFGFHQRLKSAGPTCIDHAAEVEKFLGNFQEEKTGPFFLQVGFFETHTPFSHGGVEPDRSNGVTIPPYCEDNEAAQEHFSALQGAVRRADEGVGRILDALESAGLAEDTLVIFTVDHGIQAAPDGGGGRAKWRCYDAGLGVALIMRWVNGFAGGRASNHLISNVDVLPTVLSLIGEDIPEFLDGRSFAGILHGTSDEPYVELYDLEEDPNEFRNIAECPEMTSVRNELDQRLLGWMRDVCDPLLDGPTPSPYYKQAIQDLLLEDV